MVRRPVYRTVSGCAPGTMVRAVNVVVPSSLPDRTFPVVQMPTGLWHSVNENVVSIEVSTGLQESARDPEAASKAMASAEAAVARGRMGPPGGRVPPYGSSNQGARVG